MPMTQSQETRLCSEFHHKFSDKAVFPEHGGVGIKEGNPARARPKPERAVHAKITYFIRILTVVRRPFE